MPNNASTVSLLPSFAFRSPTSPGRFPAVAKCTVSAALEPPATAPQSARNAPLRHSAIILNAEVAWSVGTTKGYVRVRDREARYGESVSSTIAMSFRKSARSR